ncbi:hypothetical protein [Burkholderia sp. Bp9031]|nr:MULTISPECIES: hypothetical protein [Burkholderia]
MSRIEGFLKESGGSELKNGAARVVLHGVMESGMESRAGSNGAR